MKQPKRIENMSPEEKNIFREKYDFFFFDLDGTLIQLNTKPFPSAKDAVAALEALGKTLHIYTDSDTYCKDTAMKNIHVYFPEFRKENIITASVLIAEHLLHIGFKKKIYAVGLEEGIVTDLKNAGFEVILDKKFNKYYTIEDVMNTKFEEGVGAVVCGADFRFSYIKLMKAVHYLMDPSVMFLVSHLPVYAHVNPIVPAAGAVALPMTIITNREPTTCSKGSNTSVEYVQSFGYDMKKCIFIGDGIMSDIRCGNKCGMDTLLVLCGHTKEHNLMERVQQGDEEFIPTYVADSVAELFNSIYKNKT